MQQRTVTPDGAALPAHVRSGVIHATRSDVSPVPIHPGAPTWPRIVDVTSGGAREIALSLPAGAALGASLNALLDSLGAHGGCGRITGGSLRHVHYHVMARATDGIKPYVYGPPIVIDGDCTLTGASLTIGHRADGSRILHCHGGFVDADGAQHGGHIVLDRSIAGADGLRAHLCLYDDVDLVVAPDSETAFDLLLPVRCA